MKILIQQVIVTGILLLTGSAKIYAQQQEKFFDMNFLVNVSRFLIANLNEPDKKQRNIDDAYYLKFENENSYFLRIPFKDKLINTDFIALETDSSGNCAKGSIVHIDRNKDGYAYLDTITIYNLKRNSKWIVYYFGGPKTLDDKAAKKPKVLDPVILTSSSNGKQWTLYLNVFAILNPAHIEPLPDGDGFGVKPTGETSGGFGTYSLYFDANRDRNNYLPPSSIEVEFERPENLKPINL